MKPLNKILIINGVIMVLYFIFGLFANQGDDHYAGLGYMIIMMIAVAIHVVISLLIGVYHFVQKNNEMGRYFLLSALLIGVVGFSACFGGGTLLSS